MSTLEQSGSDVQRRRLPSLLLWNKDSLREKNRLCDQERLDVNHTGLDGLNGLTSGRPHWENPDRTKKTL